jgi:hypothetical protein
MALAVWRVFVARFGIYGVVIVVYIAGFVATFVARLYGLVSGDRDDLCCGIRKRVLEEL